NGTCGSGTLGNSGTIGAYSASYVFTHLGQLWQGPTNGGSTQYQYLYCTSSAPHQLTGLYSLGATCTNKGTATYTSSYDAYGNVTGRTANGTTGTLSYNNLNQLVEWNAGSTNQEWYVYDAAGNRVLKRSTGSSGTTLMVYPFGQEEHQYSGSGTNQWNTYYYFLGSRLIGDMDANGTFFLLTDALGSILSDISWSAGGASIKGSQVFGPYGNARGYQGNFNTAKGFTGQYTDSLSGLDYYVSRYYDPVVGVFLSADKTQGNMQGMDPYTYVGGNPETHNDPTGQFFLGEGSSKQGLGPEYGWINDSGYLKTVRYFSYGDVGPITDYVTPAEIHHYDPYATGPSTWQKLKDATGITTIQNTFNNPHASFWDKVGAVTGAIVNDSGNILQAAMILGDPEGDVLFEGGEALAEEAGALAEEGPNLLYRVLRADEDPAIGLLSKDPNAAESIINHVLNGGKEGFESQFISTTKSLQVALKWAAKGGNRIAEIDASKVLGDIIDISTREGTAANGISFPSRAYSYAISSREVLIAGSIPAEAINWVEDVSNWMLFPPG
ncbi:MAG TPA: RHS repeat-associated core domain-containing protein, partial [Ktedonobacteraceae bacterium]|nr:RHS repeat-associated core domain-containing protein [Ktedonobacteraceae bacterium]